MQINKFIYLSFFCLFFCLSSIAQKQKVWIDADTGNEMDDIYAIARLLADNSIDITGLSSAHFNNPDLVVFDKWNQYDTKDINTVRISQELNEELLEVMNLLAIPHPIGCDRQIGRAWGGYEPRNSTAIDVMVSVVKNLKEGEKLDVICLGALTNIASAIILYPEIIPFIRCYALGARYNSKTNIWDKNEFNIRNDLNAFDYLLNHSEFDFTVMPITTAERFVFDRDETYLKLDDKMPVEWIMKKRWMETNPDDTKRILWDLALVEAYLKPELCKKEKVSTPPENTRREINAYTEINNSALIQDFWQIIKK